MSGPAALPPAALPPPVSDAMRVARVLALFFMSYTHVRPGASVLMADAFDSVQDVVESVLFDSLGRGAVPLLSIVSGVLAWHGVRRKSVADFIIDKARTLIVPMIFWNVVMLALIAAFSLATGAATLLPVGWLGHVNAVFALTDKPINTPLAFLRDIFVCGALAPLIVRALDRAPAAGLALIAGVVALLYGADSVLILRPQIFVFFALGLLLAHFGLTRHRVHPLAALLLFGVSAAVVVGVDSGLLPPSDFSTSIVNRFAVSVALWRLCLWLVERGAGGFFFRIEACIFLFFCTHWFVFFGLGFAMTRLQGGPSGVSIWAVLAEPVAGLAVAAGLMRAIRAAKLGWLGVLTGYRERSWRLAQQ